VKKIIFEIVQFLRTLSVLFFALFDGKKSCVICSKKSFFLPVCKDCLKTRFYSRLKSDLFYKQRCKICGRALISTSGTCPSCRECQVLKHVDSAFPLFSYRLWNKELLFLWKIEGIRILSALFASFCAVSLKKLSVKYIVPVPPRPGKIQKNGWDQIDELCSFLALRYGFLILNFLERVSDFQQKKLGRLERFEKSALSYRVKSDKEIKKELLKCGGEFPYEVCIVDDVCTTGSTIETCAALLKAHTDIKKISCMTLFTV
jgi:predicted amidophosphoribosyltransferase